MILLNSIILLLCYLDSNIPCHVIQIKKQGWLKLYIQMMKQIHLRKNNYFHEFFFFIKTTVTIFMKNKNLKHHVFEFNNFTKMA
jgi:hypothetical protein